MTRIAFICEGNAGRSQVAAAARLTFAERDRDAEVESPGGRSRPAASTTRDRGHGRGRRRYRRPPLRRRPGGRANRREGPSLGGHRPEGDGEVETLDVPDAHGDDLDAVRHQRDDIRRRVAARFDELV